MAFEYLEKGSTTESWRAQKRKPVFDVVVGLAGKNIQGV
jgi:hypothetical protein